MWADLNNIQRLLYCVLICFHLSAKFCLTDDRANNSDLSRRSKNIAGAATNHAASGCFHNHSLFADTSIVPTTEPCLLCKCSTRNLICVRRVCKDQPYPPPRGCILVHKKNVCCPYLSCSTKHLHINYYKNSERNRDHHSNRVEQQEKHEKTLEKHSRTDDGDGDDGSEDGEFNGGCIESGSLYASGSAMVRSSSSMCSYCYCINGHQKCIKPKCMLENTRCKPIFIDASCCPVKYDCSANKTSIPDEKSSQHSTNSLVQQRKNRSNGCHESEKFYQEGDRLPSDHKRPCELCYCIKGFRKCVVKKCAPLIKGCLPKLPEDGQCCPTSYDCSSTRRSMKIRRQVRQQNNEEDDNESIDFFSLLFGPDEPPQEEIKSESTIKFTETTTVQPFKVLPTTEQSFFDFIRAGFEIIDKNSDAISSVLTSNYSTTNNPLVSSEIPVTTTATTTRSAPIVSHQAAVVKAENVKIMTTEASTTFKTSTSTTMKPKLPHIVSSTPSTATKSNAKISSTAIKTTTRVNKVKNSTTTTVKPKLNSSTTRKHIIVSASSSTTPATTTTRSQDLKMRVSPTISTKKTTAKVKPAVAVTTTTRKRIEQTTTKVPPSTSTQKSAASVVTKKVQTTTVAPKLVLKDANFVHHVQPSLPIRKVIPTLPITSSNHAIRNPYDDFFNVIAHQLPSRKVVNEGDNEAETLPDIEIIPFVAHDAIDHDKFESYLQQRIPYEDNLEKDYFAASNTEKPFRYNNKFTQHSAMYDDVVEHGIGFPNPHERIDNGPFYYENNENQFEAFSPPREQDFIGGFAPAKENVFNEKSKLAAAEINNMQKSPVKAQTHKSNMTSEKLSLPINQTSTIHRGTVVDDVIPSFKKISNNFTSYLDNFLHHEASTTIPVSTTTLKTTTTSGKTSTAAQIAQKSHVTTSQPSKPLIDDDDFIRKHFQSPSSWESQHQSDRNDGVMEILSKPTTPTMNGLLKLAGCNIYGKMYNVGQYIFELSNSCLDCKCLPDIGVSCSPKC